MIHSLLSRVFVIVAKSPIASTGRAPTVMIEDVTGDPKEGLTIGTTVDGMEESIGEMTEEMTVATTVEMTEEMIEEMKEETTEVEP